MCKQRNKNEISYTHSKSEQENVRAECALLSYCWFSHDVTKIQTNKLLILPGFYFQDA